MKKISPFIVIATLAFSMTAAAQSGINTTTPAATLDVTARNATGTTTDVDGLLIPRVDRQRAQSMTSVPTSTLVYINSIATGTATGTTVNVDAIGYYFYNGTAWAKLTAGANNIYNTDGTLTANRTVTQGANTLAFTGTAVNGFSVDGTTLSVDAANNRVGLGTAAPSSTLDVQAINATGTSTGVEGLLIPRVDRQRAQSMTSVPTSTLIYINSIATGTATGTTVNVDAIGYYFYNGTAWTKLTAGANNIYNADGTLTANRTVTQGANTLAFTGTAVNGFSVDGTTLSVDASNNRIGIGTASPTTRLHVVGQSYFNGATADANARNVLDLNIGEDGVTWGNRGENYGIAMRSNSGLNGGNTLISRINFGDISQGNISGTRYLSFSVGRTLNELMYLTDGNSGRVGIGTTSPNSLLDLGFSAGRKLAVFNNAAGTDFYGLGIGASTMGLFASNNEVITITSGANVGIGTTNPSQKLHVIGNILASGTVTPSDIRIKKDITDNAYGLKEILGLRTINYRYKDEQLGKDKKLGFVAQEVKASMPELVTTANDEMKTLGVNYAEMTVVLTKAVQELQEVLKKQQEEINELKAQLKAKP